MRKVILAGVMLCSKAAWASYYDMYRADYAKGAFCAAIAGACASDDNPENSFFQNPASLDSSNPDLVYDGDYNPSDNAEPGMAVGDSINDTTFMGGVAKAWESWGLGIAFSARQSSVSANASLQSGETADVRTTVPATNSSGTYFFNFPVARRLGPHWAIGGALIAMYYTENLQLGGVSSGSISPIDHFPPLGYSLGVLYSNHRTFRFGTWYRSPLTYFVSQNISTQAGSNAINVSEQIGLHYPFVWASGFSLLPWGDKRAFLIDLDWIGTTTNGLERTLDRYATVSDATSVLRAKGRSLAWEPHFAWRSPWWRESAGTYTLGTYYENGRWDGIPGRIHAVGSLAYKLKFLFGLEFIATVDLARDYQGFQFSFR